MIADQTHIERAVSAEQIESTRRLFTMYEASLDTDLCFQQFEAELAELPGDYAGPSGCLLLASLGNRPAGCVALRRFDAAICEMKRLFVLPEFRGLGLGRQLVNAITTVACELGYDRMRLDTLPSMKKAIAMYESLGFIDIEPYYSNPIEGARYLERKLS